VSRGKAAIKAYYQRMVGGEGTTLKRYLTTARRHQQRIFGAKSCTQAATMTLPTDCARIVMFSDVFDETVCVFF